MKKRMLLLVVAVLLAGCGCPTPYLEHKYGYVPDEATAVQIAVSVWIPIYGKEKIEAEKPYHAKLNNGTWTVEGSLPENMLGGVAVVDIAQNDGRILRITHGR